MTFAFRPAAQGPETKGVNPATRATVPLHDARQLTGPDQTGYITLDDKVYVLRITRAGKLILTK
jgi:hemin uptake protein HemP